MLLTTMESNIPEPITIGDLGYQVIPARVAIRNILISSIIIVLFLTGIIFIVLGMARLVIYRKDKNKTKKARKKIVRGIILLLAGIVIWSIRALLTPFY